MGVAIRRQMWLECIDVVIGWCCKEVYGFTHVTYPYFTIIIVLPYSRKIWWKI